jgi:Holliday junction resolvasome RuvABC ATP-dependent DNA helicase subunit
MLALVLLLPTVCAFALQRYWLNKKSFVTVTGKPTQAYRPMRSKVTAAFFAFCTLVSAFIILLYGTVLVGAFTKTWGINYTFCMDHFSYAWLLAEEALTKTTELAIIAAPIAGILGIAITDDGSYEIASRSRGTPRIANRLLKRVRDFAMVSGKDAIDSEIAGYALNKLEIDELGLDNTDRKIMETIIKFYDGGPVGLETLAATIGEEAVTIEDVYEPYLMQLGFLSRTPRGRCVTRLAYEHLGLHVPATPNKSTPSNQVSFFDDHK